MVELQHRFYILVQLLVLLLSGIQIVARPFSIFALGVLHLAYQLRLALTKHVLERGRLELLGLPRGLRDTRR